MADTEGDKKTPEWVRIRSKDKHSFIIQREAALGSGTINIMVTGGFQETSSNSCDFEERCEPLLILLSRSSLTSHYEQGDCDRKGSRIFGTQASVQ